MAEEQKNQVPVRSQAESGMTCDPHALPFVLDQVSDGLVAMDRNGTLTIWNAAMERMTGHRREEVLGRPSSDVFPMLNIYEEQGGLALLMAGETVTLREQMHQAAQWDKPRWFDIRCTPLRGGAEQIVGVSAVIQDVTERKRRQDAEQRDKASLLHLFENLSEGLFLLDQDWHFTYLNREGARILQRPREELLGCSIWEMFPEAVNSPFQLEYRRAMKQGMNVMFQAYFEPLDLWVDVRAYPLADGLCVQFSDLTDDRRPSEDKLQQHYRSLFSEHPDAIASFDLQGRCIRVNKRLQELSGYSEGELLYTTLEWLFDEQDSRAMQLHFQQAAVGGTKKHTVRLRHREGQELTVDATQLPIVVSGQIVGVYAILHAITERTQTESELRTTKEQLEAFLNHSADAIWMVDGNDRVMQVNPAFEAMFGWLEEEVVGRLLPIIPEDLAPEINRLHHLIREGNSLVGYETRRVRKDGSFVQVSATLSPLRDSEGRVIGVSGTCRDISQSKRVEEELRATKELFESIFNYTTDAVLVFNLNGRVLTMNPMGERMAAWNKGSDWTGEPFELHHLIPTHMRHKYMDVLNGRAALVEFELNRMLEDGRLFDLQVTLSPINDDAGNVHALLLMAKDITESKKTQEMLLQTEKLSIAGQLAAGVAHEIRNPLTALKGFVQLMSLGEVDQQKYLGVMASELGRIEMIVSELLVLAKPQAMTFKRKPIVPILEDVLTLSGTQAIMHNVQFVTEYEEGLPELDCDDNQLKQVFINFIKNAIEAMPTGGTLRIEAKQLGAEQVLIRFQDEGTGIPPEHLSRLGEPFYTTKTKGTGLGLMVSKKIIESHQGCLKIASELGKGTTLDVYLPVVAGKKK